MAAVELNWNPEPKQLRQFGVIGLVFLPLLGWLLAGKPTPTTWQGMHTTWVSGFAGLGLILGTLATFRPTLLKWPFIGASLITYPFGLVIGEVLMLAIFALAFVPMALLFRVLGRDALNRTSQPEADSYWTEKEQPKNAASYYRQS